MKIALVSPYALEIFGGVQSQVLGLASALALDSDVLVVAPGEPTKYATFAHVAVGGFVRVRANGSRAPIAIWPAAWHATRDALKAFAPDVIHVHEPFVPLVGVAAARSSLAPVVATFHRADAGRLYRSMRPLLERTYRGISAHLAVSKEAARTIGDVFGKVAGDIEVLSNGVDVERFSRASRLPHDLAQVVFVGRHETRKGLSVLLEAFSSDVEARLVVVGSGPLSEQLRVRFADPGRIEFVGALDDQEMASVVASSDVAVVPSLGGESFGVVLLEAMAAGTAVLASDLEGYRLAAGDAARYFAPGDVAALRASLQQLLRSKAERDELVARGHARVRLHSFDALAQRYRSIYVDAIG